MVCCSIMVGFVYGAGAFIYHLPKVSYATASVGCSWKTVVLGCSGLYNNMCNERSLYSAFSWISSVQAEHCGLCECTIRLYLAVYAVALLYQKIHKSSQEACGLPLVQRVRVTSEELMYFNIYISYVTCTSSRHEDRSLWNTCAPIHKHMVIRERPFASCRGPS